MERYKIIRYVYDEVEEAMIALAKIRELYILENIYMDHKLMITKNKRYLIEFKLNDRSSSNLH